MLNQAKTVLLLGVLSALLVGIGGAVAPGSLGLFLVLAIVMNVGAYFFSDRIVLRMHGAQEVAPDQAPDLHRMVEELAQAANIPKPRVAIIDDPQPNAFATGRNPKHGVVAVTTGILQILSRRELRGVLAHEIAHIQHRDILVSSIAAVLGSAISGIAQMLQFGALFGGSSQDGEEEGGGGGGLALALIAPIAAMLVQFGISRSREYLADEGGAKLSGDPEALANALLKLHRAATEIPTEQPVPATASLFIVNPFAGAMQSLGRWFSTHPPVEERVRRLLELAAWSGTPVPSRAI